MVTTKFLNWSYSYDKKRQIHLPPICCPYIYVRTEFSVIIYTYVNVMLGPRNRLEKDMLILGFSLNGPNG